ncbi:primosomal protein [Vibrio cholerae]|nr:primosomal protein [Vibrio cholerae]
MSTPSIPLNEASDEIKLAVDLIYLLESHAIEPHIALAALEIVKRDFDRRCSITQYSTTNHRPPVRRVTLV